VLRRREGLERLDGTRAEQLGIAEAVDDSALDAAIMRLGQLGQVPREVLKPYTTLYRDERWPTDRFFADCADFQARFIASEAFRHRAESILSRR
jgi:hypothetical protein